MPRLPLAVLALALTAGCDAAGPDVTALDDVLLVDLVEDGRALRFETEGTPGCYTPIVHEARVTAGAVAVRVEGLAVERGPVCRAVTTSSFRVWLPTVRAPGLDVRVEHRGETDAYTVRSVADGLVLDPVRQSVTRLRESGSEPGGG